MPAGYHHLRYRRGLGAGESAFVAASECVLTWNMHRGVGFEVVAAAPRAEAGVTVALGLGRGLAAMPASCRVVWTVEEERRRGFGYATLPGHPETGEEAFVVTLDHDGRVHIDIVAFSNPARWYSRLGAPAVPPLQRLAVAAYARAVASASRATA